MDIGEGLKPWHPRSMSIGRALHDGNTGRFEANPKGPLERRTLIICCIANKRSRRIPQLEIDLSHRQWSASPPLSAHFVSAANAWATVTPMVISGNQASLMRPDRGLAAAHRQPSAPPAWCRCFDLLRMVSAPQRSH
jgi:hypothetical protein